MGNCYVSVNSFAIMGTSDLDVVACNGKKNSGVQDDGSNAKKYSLFEYLFFFISLSKIQDNFN